MPGPGSHCLEVAAPSRLHFGLLSFGTDQSSSPFRQFGGAGVMIDQPGLLLRIFSNEQLAATGPAAERALGLAHRFAAHHRLADEPR